MYSFLVLGIIPGTNIQITFTTWLQLCAVVVFVWLIRNRVMATYAEQLIVSQLGPRGIHATQVHLRG